MFHRVFCFHGFASCASMVLAAQTSNFGLCIFACSERLCQRCSLIFCCSMLCFIAYSVSVLSAINYFWPGHAGSLVLSASASHALCSFCCSHTCASSPVLFSWFCSLCFDYFGCANIFFFGSCSFARSEHRCQRCSLFILPFNLAPHCIICFRGFAACASTILATLGVFSACLVFREHLLPLCATLLCIMC